MWQHLQSCVCYTFLMQMVRFMFILHIRCCVFIIWYRQFLCFEIKLVILILELVYWILRCLIGQKTLSDLSSIFLSFKLKVVIYCLYLKILDNFLCLFKELFFSKRSIQFRKATAIHPFSLVSKFRRILIEYHGT